MLKSWSACIGICVLTGCVTPPATEQGTVPNVAEPVAEASAVEVPRIGLPPQTLGPGDCGLFLWSQTDITRFVFFARAGDNRAQILLEKGPVPIMLQRAGGDIFGQFLTDLEYSVPETGLSINITFTPGEELEGGARVSGGRISYPDADGWTRILPVLGVRACQPSAVG